MAAGFKCEPGKVLSREEEQDLQAYKDAGILAPAGYDDVVFDNTSPRGAVYRCKTTEEKQAETDDANLAAEGQARVKRRDDVLRAAGIDPAVGISLGGDAVEMPPVELPPDDGKKK